MVAMTAQSINVTSISLVRTARQHSVIVIDRYACMASIDVRSKLYSVCVDSAVIRCEVC